MIKFTLLHVVCWVGLIPLLSSILVDAKKWPKAELLLVHWLRLKDLPSYLFLQHIQFQIIWMSVWVHNNKNMFWLLPQQTVFRIPKFYHCRVYTFLCMIYEGTNENFQTFTSWKTWGDHEQNSVLLVKYSSNMYLNKYSLGHCMYFQRFVMLMTDKN